MSGTIPMFAYGETILVHHRVALDELDDYGVTQYREFTTAIRGCAVWPQSELEAHDHTRDQTSTTINCAIPPDAPVAVIDAVTWRGRRYEVDADAKYFHSPLTGRTGPTVLNLKRVEG